MAGGRAYCPFDGNDGVDTIRITGLEVEPGTHGTEIRFAASGAEIHAYKIYWKPVLGPGVERVATRPAASDRLVRLLDAPPRKAIDGDYLIEIVDVHGRSTLVTALGSVPSL